MNGAQYLYRRASGIYFVRLCVPARLKQAVGKGEIHRSTGCRDFRLAKIVAAEIAAHWHRALEAVQGMDPAKIKAGSISLLGSGFVGLTKAAQELGADPGDLARRLADRGAKFFVEASDWAGWALASIWDDAEYEHDEFGTASMVMPPRDGTFTRYRGRLLVRHPEEAVAAASGAANICQFLVWPSRERGFVVDLPGQAVVADQLQVERDAVELLRQALASQLAPTHVDHHDPAPEIEEPAGMRFSELVADYMMRRGVRWKADQRERKTQIYAMFAELMDDPPLSKITRQVMWQFADRVARVPADRQDVRRRFKATATFKELIELGEEHALTPMTTESRARVLRGVSDLFNWAVNETLMPQNPARGLADEVKSASPKPRVKQQQQRDAFSAADLEKIFSAEWFRLGVGRKTPQGRFHAYRPHYYWLPLLALHCGGRLNELSQLYLQDVVQVEGVWCLDFNLNAPDKHDFDESDPSDKSLKTVNAERVVPVHARLIELGFLGYVDALRSAGYSRLFPELHYDARKGYGKAAGSWFNERFLGRSLGIERNGRKTFHSFRHNFATALGDAQVPLPVKADLMGHSRSQALVESRYDKGAQIDKLLMYVDATCFDLPPIASFQLDQGIAAVRDALRLKERHGERSRD